MRRSNLLGQVASPDVSSIIPAAQDHTEQSQESEMMVEKEVQSNDKTPDMFQEDFTKLMMKKQHFKLCNATQESAGFSLGNSNDSKYGEDSTQVQKFVKYVDGEELSNFLDLAEQKNSQMFESFNEPFTHRTSSQNNLSTWSIKEVDCPTKQKWYFRNRSSSVGPHLGSKTGQQKRPNFGFEEIVSPTQVVPGCLEKGTATSFLSSSSSEASTSTQSSSSGGSAAGALSSETDLSLGASSRTSLAPLSPSNDTSANNATLTVNNIKDTDLETNGKRKTNTTDYKVYMQFAGDENTVDWIQDLKPVRTPARRTQAAREPLYFDNSLPDGWRREVNTVSDVGLL